MAELALTPGLEPELESEPEPESVPTAKQKKEPKPEPEADSGTEALAEPPPVTPRGIRFDDIEGMIDELLAQEE